jgi:hypothetical protein
MDAAIASIIVTIISAGASIAVALITTRARIGVPQAPAAGDPPISVPVAAKRLLAVKRFRKLGWGLVALLYLMGAYFIFNAALGFWVLIQEGWKTTRYGVFGTSMLMLGFSLAGPFFVWIGYWAKGRLKRRSS